MIRYLFLPLFSFTIFLSSDFFSWITTLIYLFILDALIKNIDGKENFLINLDQDDEKKSSCSKLINKKNKFLISSMIIRAAIVLLSVGCAAVIPYFDLFLSLIGTYHSIKSSCDAIK